MTTENTTESNRLIKVRKVSHVLRVCCWIMMAGVLILAVSIIFAPLLRSLRQGDPADVLIMISIVTVIHLVVLVGLYCLERLFRSLSQGEVFAEEGVRWLRRFGWWMLSLGAVSMLLQIGSLVFTEHLPKSVVLLQMGYPLGWLFVGLFVVVLAWLLEEAHEMKEEQALIV